MTICLKIFSVMLKNAENKFQIEKKSNKKDSQNVQNVACIPDGSSNINHSINLCQSSLNSFIGNFVTSSTFQVWKRYEIMAIPSLHEAIEMHQRWNQSLL